MLTARRERSVFHVLHAFSPHCMACGYVQGMGPSAATLLSNWIACALCLCRCTTPYTLHRVFDAGFPGMFEAICAVHERVTCTEGCLLDMLPPNKAARMRCSRCSVKARNRSPPVREASAWVSTLRRAPQSTVFKAPAGRTRTPRQQYRLCRDRALMCLARLVVRTWALNGSYKPVLLALRSGLLSRTLFSGFVLGWKDCIYYV